MQSLHCTIRTSEVNMATREGLLGRKIGMSRVFDEQGEVVPITVIEAGPCYVTQVKTVDKDGYNAIQLGFDLSLIHISEPTRPY